MNINLWLAELKVPRDAYRVVVMLPLVYVAWADGKINAAEKALILRIAREQGMLRDGGEEALQFWLAMRPTDAQLKADLQFLSELCGSDHPLAREFCSDDLQLLLAWCQDVADAAGGLLGLRSARTESELSALKKIATALDLTNAKHWHAILDR